MKDFAAIDFETANGCRSSVCSVGVVIVRGDCREFIIAAHARFPRQSVKNAIQSVIREHRSHLIICIFANGKSAQTIQYIQQK